MLNIEYIIQRVQKERTELEKELVKITIKKATDFLGNLAHYYHNRSNEDDDIVKTVLLILDSSTIVSVHPSLDYTAR